MGRSLLQGSIRKKLIILFLASAFPAFLVIILHGLQSRYEAIADSQEELLHFATHVAEIQKKTTLSIKVLLENLSLISEIREGSIDERKRILGHALKTNPYISAITLTDADGHVIATTRAHSSVNLSGGKHFRDAFATRRFAPRGISHRPPRTHPPLSLRLPRVRRCRACPGDASGKHPFGILQFTL
jgi:hypothetical protein